MVSANVLLRKLPCRKQTIFLVSSLVFALHIAYIGNHILTQVTRMESRLSRFSNNTFHRSRCVIEPLVSVNQFYNYIDTIEIQCQNTKVVGGLWFEEEGGYFDGEKYVCFDEKFNIKQNNCTVLSFGINFEYSFDDFFADYGCKVYMFDPTMGVRDHKRSKNAWFFNLGLSFFTGYLKGLGLVDRYENIIKRLRLENETIDYLKIDIEQSEIFVLQEIFRTNPSILRNVKQIGMEIHPDKYTGQNIRTLYNYQSLWRSMKLLKCIGFDVMYYHNNNVTNMATMWEGKQRSGCLELVWAQDKYWY